MKTKIKRFLKEFEKVFCYYIYAVGLSYAFNMIYALIYTMLRATSLRATIDKYPANLLHFSGQFIVLVISLFYFFYKLGYTEHKLKIKSFSASIFILFILIIIFSYYIGHAIYVSGPSVFLGDYIFEKLEPVWFYKRNPLRNVYRDKYQILTFIGTYIFVYAPIMITAKYLGIKKHKKDFSKISK